METLVFELRGRGWPASDIEKELNVTYSAARQLVRCHDAKYGRPKKTIRNARKTKQQATIREMRQNFSVFLKRVKAGETLEVLERGRPVALLIPRPWDSSPLDRLVASGRARPPAGHLGELGPPPRLRLPMSLSQALAAGREERL